MHLAKPLDTHFILLHAPAQDGVQGTAAGGPSPFPLGFSRTPACLLVLELPSERMANASPAFQQLFGYPLEALRGHTLAEAGLWPEAKKRPRAQPGFQAPLDAFEARWCKRSGELINVVLTSDIMDYEGKSYAVCLVREEHLHPAVQGGGDEVHARQDALFARVHAAVALGHVVQPEGTVRLDMNERFRELLEVDEDLPAGQQWALLCELAPELASATTQLETPGQQSFPSIWVPNLGKIIDIHLSSVDGGYFAVTAEDVTDRRRNEDALLRLNEQLRARMQHQKALVEGLLSSNEAFLYALAERMQGQLDVLAGAAEGQSPEANEAVRELYTASAHLMHYASARFMPFRRGLVDTGKVFERVVLELHEKYPEVLFSCSSMAQVTAAEAPLETLLRKLLKALIRLPRDVAEMHLGVGVQSDFLDSVVVIEARAADGAAPLGEGSVGRLHLAVEYCIAQRMALLHGGTMTVSYENDCIVVRFKLGTPVVADAGTRLRG